MQRPRGEEKYMTSYDISEQGYRVDFIAYAPLHRFCGWTVSGVQGDVQFDFEQRKIETMTFSAAVHDFDTGDRIRNKEMMKVFQVESHPLASLIMADCTQFQELKSDLFSIKIMAILEFMGIRRQLPLQLTAQRENSALKLDMAMKWSFKSYGIKAPQLLFLKVRDIVDIHAHLVLNERENENAL